MVFYVGETRTLKIEFSQRLLQKDNNKNAFACTSGFRTGAVLARSVQQQCSSKEQRGWHTGERCVAQSRAWDGSQHARDAHSRADQAH